LGKNVKRRGETEGNFKEQRVPKNYRPLLYEGGKERVLRPSRECGNGRKKKGLLRGAGVALRGGAQKLAIVHRASKRENKGDVSTEMKVG